MTEDEHVEQVASSADATDGGDDEAIRRSKIGIVLVAASVLFIAAVWIAAFAGWGSPKNVDKVSDGVWLDSARTLCAPTADRIDNLPDVTTASTPQRRAAMVRREARILQRPVDAIAALPAPDNATDASAVEKWLDDWNTHLDDRRRFARDLDTGDEGAVFTESLRDERQVSRFIDRFANTNGLLGCETPDDV